MIYAENELLEQSFDKDLGVTMQVKDVKGTCKFYMYFKGKWTN